MLMNRELFIDIETYSEVDLPTAGVFKYATHPTTEILVVAYAYDYGPVKIVDLASGEKLPHDLFDRSSIYIAHNASFEYNNFKAKGYNAPLDNWVCTMALATAFGLPASLETLGEALHLPSDKQKLKEGKALIRYFSKPCKATKANGQRTRNLPEHDRKKWELFKEYCGQDVVTMRADYRIMQRMGFKQPVKEQELWKLDVRMNEKGVKVDALLVERAWEAFTTYKDYASNEMKRLTGLANPNSTQQLKNWLAYKGVQTDSVDKEHINQILDDEKTPALVREVLLLKQSSNKTSVSKYERALSMLTPDGMIHDYLQYYGAGRTGRWAGRGIQIHNLPSRNTLLKTPEQIDSARIAVKHTPTSSSGQIERFDTNQTPTILSELIRTIIIPNSPGQLLAVADYSAIEARVLGWLANEEWRLEVFRTHGKIYEASASAMFNVPIEKISKGNSEYSLRAKGKVAELALGYQGGSGALIRMGALDMGLSEEELPGIVDRWREANPNIKRFWSKVEELVKLAIKHTGDVFYYTDKLAFWVKNGNLNIKLPSGRILVYWDVRLEPGTFGAKIVMKNVTEKGGKWADSDTYGGKLVENITQAVARDCLAEALLNLDLMGYDTLFHVHDEVIVNVTHEDELLNIISLMCTLPSWANGLPINADGFCSNYYRKD